MKSMRIVVVVGLVAWIVTGAARATEEPAAAEAAGAAAIAETPAKAGGITASLNKSLGLYVFPAKNQDAATQAKDEQDCYSWAVRQSDVDPMNLPKTEAEEIDKKMDGSGLKGAGKGAVLGGVIGAIAGDAGEGAAIGGALGGVGGLAGRRERLKNEEADAQQSATAQDSQKMDSFKKAYLACLEGKGYSVK